MREAVEPTPRFGFRVGIAIPARNEASTIRASILRVLQQSGSHPRTVAVVVNGSTDGTHSEALSVMQQTGLPEGTRIVVTSIEHASKPAALNGADEHLSDCDVLIYLDADVELSGNAFTEMIGALEDPRPRIVQPTRRVSAEASGLVRVFGRSLCALPWVRGDIACGGVFAVNRAGRSRWLEFPAIAADDAFVFTRFSPDERTVLEGCWATHPFPPNFGGLVRQQRRWSDARRQLLRAGLCGPHGSRWSLRMRLHALAKRPSLVLAATVVRLIRFAAALAPRRLSKDSWMPER